MGVVAQVRAAIHPSKRLGALLGALLGGLVPLVTYILAHHEVDASAPLAGQVATYLVLGGLAFSAPTVYGWGKIAFRSNAKAGGFVVLLEGTLTLAHTPWLSVAALVYLVAINAIATGCALSLPADE
jgi:hypothetical protein